MVDQVALYFEDEQGKLIPASLFARSSEIKSGPIVVVGNNANITIFSIAVPIGKVLTLFNIIQGSSDDLGYILFIDSNTPAYNIGAINQLLTSKGRGELWNPEHPLITIDNNQGTAIKYLLAVVPLNFVAGFLNSDPNRTFWGNVWYFLQ